MKKQTGITLIALVVTIIILIILAGVSINLLVGDNGIITMAKTAKVKTEFAAIEEEVKTYILGQELYNVSNIMEKYPLTIDESGNYKTLKNTLTQEEINNLDEDLRVKLYQLEKQVSNNADFTINDTTYEIFYRLDENKIKSAKNYKDKLYFFITNNEYKLIYTEGLEVDGEVAFADLDIVNVYFRTREKKDELRSMGINPIDSSIETDTLDLPAVSAQIMTPLHNKDTNYVLDVGGDNVGTRVVGRFAEHFVEGEYDMFCVVNANREQTQTAEDVIKFIKSMEASSKLKVTGLINNTHFIRQTTVEYVLKGQKLVKEVSELTNIPIKYVSCLKELVDLLPSDLEGDILPIDLYMREIWM